jgi:hypothetical protein
MSTQWNQYLIYGVKISYGTTDEPYEKYEDFFDSAFEGIKQHRGLCVLYDGMNGDYILIGHVLEKSDEGQPFQDPMDLEAPTGGFAEVIAGAIEREFGIEKPQLKLWLVTHYR